MADFGILKTWLTRFGFNRHQQSLRPSSWVTAQWSLLLEDEYLDKLQFMRSMKISCMCSAIAQLLCFGSEAEPLCSLELTIGG